MKYSITKQPKSVVEIDGSISLDRVTKLREKAIKTIAKDVTLPGFRKGHAPEKAIIEKLGEQTILEEVAEIALDEDFPKIIVDEKLDVIGRPKVLLTKVAAGNPIEYKITVTVVPEVTLPDYKKIAKKINNEKVADVVVDEKEIDEVVEHVRKSWAHHEAHKDGSEHKEGEEHALPEWNDEFVKKVGAFETVADFRAKAKENLALEKQEKVKDAKRASLIDAILSETKAEIPELLTDAELNKMLAQFEDDILRMGIDIEEYLKHLKKTREELRDSWRPDAEKRAKTSLMISEIGTKEKIVPDATLVETQVEEMKKAYPQAEEKNIRYYVESQLSNKAIIEFLEEIK